MAKAQPTIPAFTHERLYQIPLYFSCIAQFFSYHPMHFIAAS